MSDFEDDCGAGGFDAGGDDGFGHGQDTGVFSTMATLHGLQDTDEAHLDGSLSARSNTSPKFAAFGAGPKWKSQDSRWEANTMATLGHAKNLVQQAMSVHRDNNKVKGETAVKHVNSTAAVQSMVKKKIGSTNDMVKAIEARIESVDDTIRQVGECLVVLQRAYRSKWAPLNVSERRLELRERRPLQELVKDHVQEALEHERQTLLEARQEIADQVQSSKEMLVRLDELKGELILDMSHKRHGQRIDRSCLSARQQKPIGRSPQDDKERVVLPQVGQIAHYNSPASPKEAEKGTGEHHEVSRQMGTKELLQRAVKTEEEAMRLCNDSDAAMLHTKRECARSSAQTQSCLSSRYGEIAEMKQKLESQLSETDLAIQATQRSLAKTHKQLHAHEHPLRILDKQFDLRAGRTAREGIRDPVTDELETHLEGVKVSVKVLQDKWQSTKDVLDQLQASRDHMAEDLRCKSMAFKIDDACLKVTPKKSMELDRLDPRGGRCQEPAKKSRPRPAPVHFTEALY